HHPCAAILNRLRRRPLVHPRPAGIGRRDRCPHPRHTGSPTTSAAEGTGQHLLLGVAVRRVLDKQHVIAGRGHRTQRGDLVRHRLVKCVWVFVDVPPHQQPPTRRPLGPESSTPPPHPRRRTDGK